MLTGHVTLVNAITVAGADSSSAMRFPWMSLSVNAGSLSFADCSDSEKPIHPSAPTRANGVKSTAPERHRMPPIMGLMVKKFRSLPRNRFKSVAEKPLAGWFIIGVGKERCPSGRRSAVGNRVIRKGSWVRIPPAPPSANRDPHL